MVRYVIVCDCMHVRTLPRNALGQ